MADFKEKAEKLIVRYKYPFLILALGIALMLMPSGGSKNQNTDQDSESSVLSYILSHAEGVGKAEVLISDKGVLIVCKGADSAKTRLEIISAVTSYTGYGSDKITILKMADQA